jgi:hypothetical protein
MISYSYLADNIRADLETLQLENGFLHNIRDIVHVGVSASQSTSKNLKINLLSVVALGN